MHVVCIVCIKVHLGTCTQVRASLQVHTDVVRGVTLTAHGSLERPTILPDPMLNFQLTQVSIS